MYRLKGLPVKGLVEPFFLLLHILLKYFGCRISYYFFVFGVVFWVEFWGKVGWGTKK